MFPLRDSQVVTLRKKRIGDALLQSFEGSKQTAARDSNTGDILVRDPEGNVIRLTFDGLGFVGQLTSPLGRHWKLENDSEGRMLGLIDPAGLHLGFRYDGAGRATSITRDSNELLRLGYDEDSNLTQITYADRTSERTTYRAGGKPLEIVSRLGKRQRFEYDSKGNLAAISDGNGNRTEFRYGAWDRPDSTLYPDGTVETYKYSPQGFVQSIATPAGTATTIEHDGSGRPIQTRYRDGEILSFLRDDGGRVVEAKNPTLTVKYQYDADCRVIAEDYGSAVVKYQYDESGTLVAMTYPSGDTVEFGYDADSRLSSVKDWSGGRSEFAYAESDRRFVHRLPNGLTSATKQTSAGIPSLTSVLKSSSSESALFSFEYLYDSEDRLQAFTDSELGLRTYVYDAESQLLSVRRVGKEDESFAYDSAGNRISANGQNAVFNSLNQLTRQGDVRCAFDSSGNMVRLTSPGGQWNFFYNARNLMIRAEGPSGVTVSFAYDAFGRRIRKEVADKKIHYVWAGEQLISEITTDARRTTVREYLYFPGTVTPLALRDGGSIYYYHTDHLGTVRRISDAHGKVVWSADYTGYGEAHITSADLAQSIRLPGQYHDDETGLCYNRFRYYSPALGRYLSRDPLTFLNGTNFYGYCGNNPVNAADTLGLSWWKTAIAVAAAVAVGVAVVALAPVALPLAIVAAGAAAGAVGAGLNEALNEDHFSLKCIATAALKGAIVGTIAALPFAFLPAAAGVAAYTGTGALSGALGYTADFLVNFPHATWNWGQFALAVGIGAATAGVGRYLGPRVARWWKGEGTGPSKTTVPPEMQQKILYGNRVPGSNRLIGAHSPNIKTSPDYAVEVLSDNPDGTTTVKLTKQYEDGNLANIKKSTLAPDSWSDAKVIQATEQVGDTPPVATRADGATLHRSTVDGVQWEVIKDGSGNVTSSYPTGGNPTTNF